MILHTIVSEQDIFMNSGFPYNSYGEASCTSAQMASTTQCAPLQRRSISGGFAEYRRENGTYQLANVYSTDPAMYLPLTQSKRI